MTLRLGWFATAKGTGSYNLLEATTRAKKAGLLDAEIVFVFCNREPGEADATDRFFELVRANDIPLLTLSSVRFRRERGGTRSRPGSPLPEWRADFDAEVERLVAPYRMDVGVLAGYMLIFTPEACRRLPLLNLHPAAPGGPAGTWQEVIRQLIRDGASESGVMTIRAIPEVDAGPPVSYCRYTIRDAEMEPLWQEAAEASVAAIDDTRLFHTIRRRGATREVPLLVATLQALAAGERRIDGLRVVDREGRDAEPLDLTSQVEAAIAASRPTPR